MDRYAGRHRTALGSRRTLKFPGGKQNFLAAGAANLESAKPTDNSSYAAVTLFDKLP